MKRIVKLFLAVLILLGLIVPDWGCTQTAKNKAPQESIDIQKAVQGRLDQLDKDTAGVAKKLSGLDLAGTETRNILVKFIEEHKDVTDILVVDRYGKTTAVGPEQYRSLEGEICIDPVNFIEQKPHLSALFQAKEGFPAAGITHPIFSNDKKLSGAVGAIIRPEFFLKQLIEPLLPADKYIPVCMQSDGYTLYHSFEEETGKYGFASDKVVGFEKTEQFVRKACLENSGSGEFTLYNTGVNKTAWWVTAGLYGTEWRLVLFQT